MDAFGRHVAGHFADVLARRVVVAFSGGSDSLALLVLFLEAVDLGVEVVACHVHHHARGDAADRDAAFAAATCDRLGVRFLLASIDEPRPPGASPEAWWRHERYRLLELARTTTGAAVIATGHTLDDQAETVLLKLLRGAGPRGVAGIRPRRGAVIRPLLPFRREVLRAFLRSRGEHWCEDATNESSGLPRARVRGEILPSLERVFPRATEHLARFAGDLAEDDAWIQGWVAGLGTWPTVGSPVPAAGVAALPPPLRRRWILALAARLPLDEPPSRVQLTAVEDLLAGKAPAAVDLGRRFVLRRHGSLLHLDPPPCAPFGAVAAGVPSTVALPGGFVGRVAEVPLAEAHGANIAPVPAGSHLAWRAIRPGERCPDAGGRRVADLLRAAGVPRPWRRAWPVLEADGTMVWLPAVVVARGWQATGEGIRVALEEPWQRLERS